MGVDRRDELEKRKLMSEPKFGRELSKFMHLELGCSGAAGAAGAVERVPGSGAHYGPVARGLKADAAGLG